eukprot:3340296-Rhodomonas_salina.1
MESSWPFKMRLHYAALEGDMVLAGSLLAQVRATICEENAKRKACSSSWNVVWKERNYAYFQTDGRPGSEGSGVLARGWAGVTRPLSERKLSKQHAAVCARVRVRGCAQTQAMPAITHAAL